MGYTFTQWWSPNKTAGRGGHAINKIVLHHAATTNFDGIGATFQNTSTQTSAHYGVGPGKVCQYVDINDTAYHAGVWRVNQESIGVEHVNSSGHPNWDISDETIQTGGELLANIAKQLGWSHLAIGENVFFHSDFKSTYCPGKLRDAGLGQKEVAIANGLLGSGNVEQPSVTPSQPAVSTSTGWCYFDYRGNVRQQPTTESAIMATYNAGTWVEYVGFVHGQNVNGSDKWLKSKIHGWYVHESVTGGTWGLKDLGSVSTGGGKSLDAIANEVLAGQWGNGDDRRNRLQAAGYDYNAVQALVNQKLGVGSAPAGKSNEQIADEVIRGEWGNGDERRQRLQAAGYDYNAIQAIVNRKL